MKPHLYRITCLTNLHVGSGEANYNIIDNEVEKDPVMLNVPVIYDSGVKGALRAHCMEQPALSDECVDFIFGSDKQNRRDSSDKLSGKGQFKFLAASLIVRPLRVSSGTRSYALTTTPEIIETFGALAKGLGFLGFDSITVPEAKDKPQSSMREVSEIEDEAATVFDPDQYQLFAKLVGSSNECLAVVGNMKDYALPVVARNQLDNGVSNNLWYEEIVPHKSRFYFFVLVPEEAENDGTLDEFNAAIIGPGVAVQFGGNASVGQGYCKIEEIKGDCDE
jgi:CRISPR-associated protein Cmr4